MYAYEFNVLMYQFIKIRSCYTYLKKNLNNTKFHIHKIKIRFFSSKKKASFCAKTGQIAEDRKKNTII